MMEESSDESAEIITKEEAELAEEQQVHKPTTPDVSPQTPASSVSMTPIGPPAPLPSFLTQATPPAQTPPANVAQVPVIPQTTSVASPVNVTASPEVTAVVKPSIQPPGPVQSPYEASTAIEVSPDMVTESPQSPAGSSSSLFGWITGNKLMSKMVEKTKSSVESMITTLDPGMKEVIHSGGDIHVVVTSTKDNKVGAIREAFQQVFGRATVEGEESQATTAAQPVGFTAGLKGAEERIQNLRRSGNLPDNIPVISVEGFIVEMLPDRWYEMSCLVLQDPSHRIDLQTFSQPSPIPAEYILTAHDRTPSDYPLRWSGLAVTIGQVVEEARPHIGHTDWQNGIVGVSRRESLFLAAKSLAYMYRQRLPSMFLS